MSFYHDIGHYPSFLKHNPIAHVNNQSAECRGFLWASVFLKKNRLSYYWKKFKGDNWLDISLRKIPKIRQLSRCINFMEMHDFRRVSGESPETLRKLCASENFLHHEISWNYDISYSVSVICMNVNFIEKLISAYDTTKSKCSEAAEAMRSVMSLIHWKSKRKTITAKIP